MSGARWYRLGVTSPDIEAAIAAVVVDATHGSVAAAIRRATVGSVEAALNDYVSPSVLHEVDEALIMPSVGAVAVAVDPIGEATERAVSEALDAASGKSSDPAGVAQLPGELGKHLQGG